MDVQRERQFLHLVRFAGDLWEFGRAKHLHLPPYAEPVLLLSGAHELGEIIVAQQGDRWQFNRSRRPRRRVAAYSGDVAGRIAAVVR